MSGYIDEFPDACVRVERHVLGMLGNNVYIISALDDPANCIVVDPSCHEEYILGALGGRIPQAIILTHYHFDHVGAAAALREACDAPVYAHVADVPHITGAAAAVPGHRKVAPCTVDVALEGGEDLAFVGVTWRVMHTPGHSPGSMCLFAEGMSAAYAPTATTSAASTTPAPRPVLIAGDTLFAGNIGRVDFADGSPQDMRSSLTILRALPSDTLVLPGHGELTVYAELEQSVFSRYLGARPARKA